MRIPRRRARRGAFSLPGGWGMTEQRTFTAFSPLSLSPVAWHDPSQGVQTGCAPAISSSSQYLTNSSADFNTGPGVSFAWAGWVRLNSMSGTYYVIAGKDNGSTVFEWALFVGLVSSNKLTIVCYQADGSASEFVTWATALTVGTWYFVAIWKDSVGNTISLSVDTAAAVSTSTSRPSAATAVPFAFGNFGDGSLAHLPAFSVCASGYWARTLSGSDLTALYNSGVPLHYLDLASAQKTNLVAYWDLASPSFTDDSGNGHTLTAHGTIYLTSLAPANHNAVAGQNCSLFPDLSPHARHYRQLDGFTGPQLTAGVQNGLPMLLGNGVNVELYCDAIGSALLGTNQAYAFFCVIKGLVPNGANQQIFLAATRPLGPNDPATEMQYDGGASNLWMIQDRADAGVVVQATGGSPDASAHVMAAVADATTMTMYVDGTSIASLTRHGGSMTLNTFSILAHRNFNTDGGGPATFYYGEDLILNFAPSGALLTQLFSYFRTKWGTP